MILRDSVLECVNVYNKDRAKKQKLKYNKIEKIENKNLNVTYSIRWRDERFSK
jgi:hypothetical protein